MMALPVPKQLTAEEHAHTERLIEHYRHPWGYQPGCHICEQRYGDKIAQGIPCRYPWRDKRASDCHEQ